MIFGCLATELTCFSLQSMVLTANQYMDLKVAFFLFIFELLAFSWAKTSIEFGWSVRDVSCL